VSGYNVEYSGTLFIFWFLSEYGFLLWYSVLRRKIFFNWSGLPVLFFYFITWLLLFFRRCLPRYRYDKLIAFFWGSILPISIFIIFFYYIICSL
jgi:NADH:ubiquinone oxidoreductase subunit H